MMKPTERVMPSIKTPRISGHLSAATFDGTGRTTHLTECAIRRHSGLVFLIIASAARCIIHTYLPMRKRALLQTAALFATNRILSFIIPFAPLFSPSLAQAQMERHFTAESDEQLAWRGPSGRNYVSVSVLRG